MQDEDVTKKSGIYPYVLTRNEKIPKYPLFTEKQKREAYEKQKGVCKKCKDHFEIEEMEADHIKPWHQKAVKQSPEIVRCCASKITELNLGYKMIGAQK